MDPLSDILAILKPESYLTAGIDAGGEWAIRFGNRPGTIKCHAVTAGGCWLAVDGMETPVRLTAGDFVSSCRADARSRLLATRHLTRPKRKTCSPMPALAT